MCMFRIDLIVSSIFQGGDGRIGLDLYLLDQYIFLLSYTEPVCSFVACCDTVTPHRLRVGNVTVAPHPHRCLAQPTSVLSWFWESQQCNVWSTAAGRDSADPTQHRR